MELVNVAERLWSTVAEKYKVLACVKNVGTSLNCCVDCMLNTSGLFQCVMSAVGTSLNVQIGSRIDREKKNSFI